MASGISEAMLALWAVPALPKSKLSVLCRHGGRRATMGEIDVIGLDIHFASAALPNL